MDGATVVSGAFFAEMDGATVTSGISYNQLDLDDNRSPTQ